jgi:hypothetical protein
MIRQRKQYRNSKVRLRSLWWFRSIIRKTGVCASWRTQSRKNPLVSTILVEFQAEGNVVANFELMLKRDERVLRFLTVKMDVDHVNYSVKRRAKAGATA